MIIVNEFNGFWMDVDCNKWDQKRFSKDEAIKQSKELVNCKFCVDCYKCTTCIDCRECTICTNCRECVSCFHCIDCIECTDCNKVYDCSNCNECINLCDNDNITGSKNVIIPSKNSGDK